MTNAIDKALEEEIVEGKLVVTIENYTEHCLKTWEGENQKERAELGIIGELGEVAEVLKKFLRGDFDEVERDKLLLEELGDVCYYVAIKIHLDMYDFSDICKSKICPLLGFEHHSFQFYSKEIICSFTDRGNMVSNFILICDKYNFTLEQVMQANIEKLQCRASRGVIKGSGSSR